MMTNESIVGKAVLEGNLLLLSPLLISNGQGAHEAGEEDIAILRNGRGEPFIPGTSLAGALRAFFKRQGADIAQIFGDLEEQQSTIHVSDIVFRAGEASDPAAKGAEKVETAYRTGVALERVTGTAKRGALYDYEVIERGAKAPLRMEFHLWGVHTNDPSLGRKAKVRPEIMKALRQLRLALEQGIGLGAHTTKGFGRVRLENGALGLYDFAKKEAVRTFLLTDKPSARKATLQMDMKGIALEENPQDFCVEASFTLRTPLLIRDYQLIEDKKIAESMRSRGDAVIPGSTWKGVLRHRAEKIAAGLGYGEKALEHLMGTAAEEKRRSRLVVEETYLPLGEGFAQKSIMRNRIDRFTGGTIYGALFQARPVYQAKKEASLTLRFRILGAKPEEAGLALFLLKDLWQGDLSIGGEAGVGRGRLAGRSARISYDGEVYELDENGTVTKGDAARLEAYAEAWYTRKEEA